MLEIALYHPQIPQNTGTLLRVSSCLGIHVNLIGPLGFIFDDKRMRRAGMDYLSSASFSVHTSFTEFISKKQSHRLIALDIGEGAVSYTKFRFANNDILVVGSEHSGFEDKDLNFFDSRVIIPMVEGRRSMNMAIATSFVLGEAMRQLDLFDKF